MAESKERANLVDRHVGSRIQGRREIMGMAQDDLASVIGVSYQQLHKYEAGANRVSASRLHVIAEHLDVSVGYFFEGLNSSGKKTVAVSGRAEVLKQIGVELAEVRDLGVCQSILAVVKALARR